MNKLASKSISQSQLKMRGIAVGFVALLSKHNTISGWQKGNRFLLVVRVFRRSAIEVGFPKPSFGVLASIGNI